MNNIELKIQKNRKEKEKCAGPIESGRRWWWWWWWGKMGRPQWNVAIGRSGQRCVWRVSGKDEGKRRGVRCLRNSPSGRVWSSVRRTSGWMKRYETFTFPFPSLLSMMISNGEQRGTWTQKTNGVTCASKIQLKVVAEAGREFENRASSKTAVRNRSCGQQKLACF